ncbi:MAG: glycosyltransferase, partial [Candidatus Binatia bacterium]
VATRVGAAHHIVVDEHAGYLVAPGNVEALADRLAILMGDPQLTIAMGQCGRAHVVDHFSIEREARELESVYQSCWNRSQTGSQD